MWRERLRRFSKSGLSVARFCEREKVSPASFYQWRRKLAERGAFQQVVLAESEAKRDGDAEVGFVAIDFAGVRVKVPADRVELVRAVVRELVRATGSDGIDSAGETSC